MGYIIHKVVCLIVCFTSFQNTPVKGVFVKSMTNNSSMLTFLKGGLVARGERKCHDFCTMMPGWCRNGGTCVTQQATCVGTCICPIFWTGQRCESKPVLDRSSLESILGVLTNNSRHDTPSLRDIGQDGVIRNIANNSTFQNGLLAMLHGITHTDTNHEVLKNDNTEPSLNIVQPNEPEPSGGIVRHVDDTITTPTHPHYNDLSLSECTQTCTNGDCIKINDIYKCKHRIDASVSRMEKVCDPGFVCVHGVCDMEAKEDNSYDCICESNYVGQFCDYECPVDCGQHGFCDYDVTESVYKCFCQWNYTGYNCSELIPIDTDLLSMDQRVSFHWYVLGASLTLVVLILAGSLIAGYFLWKKRLVFVLKIVHFFKEYEDEDGKEFDAFVSYRSTERDEKFVLTQLYPRLEGNSKFKLCLHFRDFEPGEAIANNIVRAIENSRRTIMILSPAYVKSEWCRLEYQKAQHEMLKLKHRIIPIVLEDISEVYKDLDTNLRSILDSVTYLKWPGPDESGKKVDRFWQKLELSLPKKSTASSSLLSSSSSVTSSEPLSDISVTSPSDSVNIKSSKPPLTLSIPSGPTCPSHTDKSSNDGSNSPKTHQRRRKNFRHFIDKFVRNKLQFNRQDSNSSQMALVDEETAGSRSSCDSVSDSILTESTESICSTPATANTYLDETVGDISEPSSYFSVGLKRMDSFKEKHVIVCEKDHCEGTECSTCIAIVVNQRHENKNVANVVDDTDADSSVCELCKREQDSADNNRVKISAIEGSDQIRIQKLPGIGDHTKCNHGFKRGSEYRGSLKNRKDAMNRELSILNRAGTLPRNFRSKIIAKRADISKNEVSCDVNDKNRTSNSSLLNHKIASPSLKMNEMRSSGFTVMCCQSGSDCVCKDYTNTLSEKSNNLTSIDSDKTFSSNGYSCIEPEDSLTYDGIISIDSGDSFSNDGSLC